MAKFKSNADGPISVSSGPATVSSTNFEPGETVEVDDPAVVAAFQANPDLEEVQGGVKGVAEKLKSKRD